MNPRGTSPVLWVLVGVVRFYQMTVSRILPSSCRFTPSCSQYAVEAMREFGAWRGLWMGLKRIVRCHPFHPGGYDPVRR